MQGSKVKNVTTGNYQFSVSDLPTGLYLIRTVESSGRIYSSRFIKK
jgi:hypothetical protein